MRINRFKEILKYSLENKESIENKTKDFYSLINMDKDRELLNIMQISRGIFEKEGYIIVEIPFADKEIGAISYAGDGLGYVFLNSSLPKVNINFALCHEIYHVFYQKMVFKNKVELLNEHYYEYEEEFAANLFAGMLLMPEDSYKQMYFKFLNESKTDDTYLSLIAKLMNYFEAPYMAALIRCYELNLLESGEILKELIEVDSDMIKAEFDRLWLDSTILNASKKDEYKRFEYFVSILAKQYQEEDYISAKVADKALHNMRELYEKIKGE